MWEIDDWMSVFLLPESIPVLEMPLPTALIPNASFPIRVIGGLFRFIIYFILRPFSFLIPNSCNPSHSP